MTTGISEDRNDAPEATKVRTSKRPSSPPAQPSGEKRGPRGPEPTRYGDWEKNGRCYDF